MHAMMRYTVKVDAVGTHLRLLYAVYDELEKAQPDELGWTVFRVADSNTFIESVQGPDLPLPLPLFESFRAYRGGLEERCQDDLEFLVLNAINSYRSRSLGPA